MNTTDWKNLRKNNYSIQYPDSWRLDQSGQMGTSFIIFPDRPENSDKFLENVNLLIQDLKGLDMDLEKFTEISLSQIRSFTEDSKVLECNRQTKAGTDYQIVSYTGTQETGFLHWTQYYFVLDEKAYILTLTTEDSYYEEVKETGLCILDSFEVYDR